MTTNYRIAALDAATIAGMTDADIASHIERFESLQADGVDGYGSNAEEDAGRLLYNERDQRAVRVLETRKPKATRSRQQPQWFLATARPRGANASTLATLFLVGAVAGAEVEDALRSHGIDAPGWTVQWEPLSGCVYGTLDGIKSLTVVPMVGR